MKRSIPVLRGRGASNDPPNRFEELHIEPLPEEQEDSSLRPTQYFRDHSRSVLTRNDSPDVGFEWSLNPYRGCTHGCSYCLSPDTPVLHSNLSSRRLGDVTPGDVLVGFDEYPEQGRDRKLRPAAVGAVWWSRRPTIRITTDRSEVVTTAEHKWFDARGRWVPTSRLLPGRRLRYLRVTSNEEGEDDDYRAGYITGISLGDATFRFEPNWRSDHFGFPPAYWRLALADEEPLHRTAQYLKRSNVEVFLRPFASATASRRGIQKIETRALGQLAKIHSIITRERETRSYRRGFLAAFFDAEGYHGDSLRITQKDRIILERVRRYGADLGFDFYVEGVRSNGVHSMRLRGSVADRIRFFAVCKPAISRKRDAQFGWRPPTESAAILAVEPGPVQDVVDIQTSTRTFYAAGLATHNCFARPTHEYLGLSAGLDFESKIFVKTDAPELLERHLASPKWQPKPVTVSGVTDCYQPIERRLEITRRCLEVMTRARNPLTIVTKSRLVTRDVDLLADLAHYDAAHVAVSITTLDRNLQRAMEPRASPPEHRLEAVRILSGAGVPVTVLIAPVIPGLTDHEIPALVQAAADAGARGVGYVILRLPGAVKDVFLSWMDDHIPDRAGKVKSRLRSMHAGKLYESEFGKRMRGEGPFAEHIDGLFEVAIARARFRDRSSSLSTEHFIRPVLPASDSIRTQLDLF